MSCSAAIARTTLTTLELGIDDGTAKRVLPEVERGLSRFNAEGLRVYLVGQAAAVRRHQRGRRGRSHAVELILLPLVVAILLILYRSVAAALISLVVSVTAIVVATGALTWLAGVVELNVIVQSIVTMLGLGVSVDYSLIMIRRFIDEVASSDRGAALTNTMRTAGRTVAASGTTVAAALATLLIVDMPLIRSIAIAGDHRRGGGGPRMSCRPSRGVVPARSSRGGVARAVAAVHPGSVTPSLGQTCPDHHGQTGCRVGDHVCRPTCPRGAGAWTADGQRRRLGSAEEFVGSPGLRSGRGAVREGCRRADIGVIESDRSFSGTEDFARLAAMTTGFSQLNHTARVASPVSVLQAVMPADPLAAIEPTNFQRLPGIPGRPSIDSCPLTAKRLPLTYFRTGVPATPTSRHS